jgi:hypothetical protein
VLEVPAGLLAHTFARLRDCGAGRAECVQYWCADLTRPDLVVDVVHPVHTATAVSYDVDEGWVTPFFLTLRAQQRTVRAQVHTHPGRASHSSVDDRFALAPATGFMSLVIPDFAAGAPSLHGSHLVAVAADGTWHQRDPNSAVTDV